MIVAPRAAALREPCRSALVDEDDTLLRLSVDKRARGALTGAKALTRARASSPARKRIAMLLQTLVFLEGVRDYGGNLSIIIFRVD